MIVSSELLAADLLLFQVQSCLHPAFTCDKTGQYHSQWPVWPGTGVRLSWDPAVWWPGWCRVAGRVCDGSMCDSVESQWQSVECCQTQCWHQCPVQCPPVTRGMWYTDMWHIGSLACYHWYLWLTVKNITISEAQCDKTKHHQPIIGSPL